MLGAVGYGEALDSMRRAPVGQLGIVPIPHGAASGLDVRRVRELSIEQSRLQFGAEIVGADVHPGVLVHLAPEEAAAVRSFLAGDLGAFDERQVVDQERAAL